jgi:synaptobrevin homolog YKT6
MKLFGILILTAPSEIPEAVVCSSAIDVSSFGYFQRSSAQEFIIFISRTVAKRAAPNSKIQVVQEPHVIFAQASADGLVAIAVCDNEYNPRVAFTMLSQVLQEFQMTFRGKYQRPVGDNFIQWPELQKVLTQYQNPEEADKILKIKKDIEETKVIMYDAIDKILERGEKIDNLVAKSDDLGMASKTFYTQAKKTNSGCCAVM